MFYFEDSLNKSIYLWKREYSVAVDKDLTTILWEEYLKILDYTLEDDECNDWDRCMPWAMYVAFGKTETKLRLNIGTIIVKEIEEKFRKNFTPRNFGKEFREEYLGFRNKDLAMFSLDEYMKYFGMSFKNDDNEK